MASQRRPEIIECELRLHSGPPGTGVDPSTGDAAAWSETEVGRPVSFEARADPPAGAWNGPLPPGVDISAPATIDDPWWTVRLPGSTGVPLLCGRVGRPLGIGDTFQLAPNDDRTWTTGIPFEGHPVDD